MTLHTLGDWNPGALLIGLQDGAATLENGTVSPQNGNAELP